MFTLKANINGEEKISGPFNMRVFRKLSKNIQNMDTSNPYSSGILMIDTYSSAVYDMFNVVGVSADDLDEISPDDFFKMAADVEKAYAGFLQVFHKEIEAKEGKNL